MISIVPNGQGFIGGFEYNVCNSLKNTPYDVSSLTSAVFGKVGYGILYLWLYVNTQHV